MKKLVILSVSIIIGMSNLYAMLPDDEDVNDTYKVARQLTNGLAEKIEKEGKKSIEKELLKPIKQALEKFEFKLKIYGLNNKERFNSEILAHKALNNAKSLASINYFLEEDEQEKKWREIKVKRTAHFQNDFCKNSKQLSNIDTLIKNSELEKYYHDIKGILLEDWDKIVNERLSKEKK
ncbi:MAG: hypothetical protein ACD_16C00007G0006 [uncultured bacterium]|nr:MAG: hypothetical protein ACD_16C00007G0006 [uncultured bacterium]OFW69083.1 MAG: hypothetical protein A2X70_02025 [Alphaproteobacteria bacterium GWC2_42_16]OFW73940.1 MAG: hypothetical protein A2Z80_03040 [Alphaproteobacteria bacterium GWA2_41_27]OFW82479.1 MAG: hypothetical protein A3E50_06965 [Alphaproteobacteria bacterium RIFCSPHIGHO2_12_FULL_42_100]OFW86602.1 MAG: hypothetical protein A2W06_08000 [Alphaproteobacteria bacterium RBG_16_42_14]OFW91490.1 MAG: hypothetical protein A3C41_075